MITIQFLGGGRFFDPRTKQSFKYDHLRKEASDFQNYEPDSVAEPWRSALDVEAIQYTANHYRHGVCSVFGRNDPSTNQITLSLCIEDHQFQPKNYWNGRWRSQWNFTFSNSGSGTAEAKGVLKVQVWQHERISYKTQKFKFLGSLLWRRQRSACVFERVPRISGRVKRGANC